MFINSKGFRMRRDREAKQELGINTYGDRTEQLPEQPMNQQSAPERQKSGPSLSLLSRLWRKMTG